MSRFQIRRLQLKAKGLCVYCGGEPAIAGKTICLSCSAVRAAKRPRCSAIVSERRRLVAWRDRIRALLNRIEADLLKIDGKGF